MTADFSDDNKQKFDTSTPSRGNLAYERILLTFPSSLRICQDIRRVFRSMDTVRKAKGIKVDGLGNSKGKRQTKRQEPLPKGGRRPRKQGVHDYGGALLTSHPDAICGAKIKLQESLVIASGKEMDNKKWVISDSKQVYMK